MKRIRRWITARLWRRLVFSHLVVILLTVLILQICVVTLVMWAISGGMQPIEGDAGLLARALAQTAGRLMETGRTEDIPFVLEMMKQGVVTFPDPYPDNDPYTSSPSSPEVWFEHTTAVIVLDESGGAMTTLGDGVAQQEYPAMWNELVSLAKSGETDPYKLSRWLTHDNGGLMLGTAGIIQSSGKSTGVVVVEMRPASHSGTYSESVFLLFGLLATMATTSTFFGLPVLTVAGLIAAFSAFVVSRSLGHRLKRLEHTAQQMAGGNLSLRIPDTSPDEIGHVGHAFNRMAEQLAHSLETLEAEKEQVDALMKARRDLVANISHDLRTPVASLSVHLESLSEHPERLGDYLSILDDETARVSRLIDDLFELSQLDAHELKLDLSPVMLSSVVDKAIASYKKLFWEQRRIVLETDLPDQLPPVLADVQRIEQVLANLITNSLRFTPEGGIVTIEAQALPGEIEVCVSDTGIGIPQEDLPHIFDRFYRGDRSRTRTEPGGHLGSGSGLGLAIVKELIEAMDGSVSATSAPGEGTRVSFRLPLADAT